MSRVLTTTAAVLAGCAMAVPADAATVLSAKVEANPSRAGSTRHPQGVMLRTMLELTTPEGEDGPGIAGWEVWLGPGITFNGDRFPTCRVTVLRNDGPRACPPKALMGSGHPVDPRTIMDPPSGGGGSLTFFNAPARRLAAWIVLSDPVRVQAATVGTMSDGKPGPWPHREAWTTPPALGVVGGIPIAPLRYLSYVLGGKAYAKTYFTSTRCPAGGWAWRVRVHTSAATTLDTRGRAPCHR
jgi:hypothetical protein